MFTIDHSVYETFGPEGGESFMWVQFNENWENPDDVVTFETADGFQAMGVGGQIMSVPAADGAIMIVSRICMKPGIYKLFLPDQISLVMMH